MEKLQTGFGTRARSTCKAHAQPLAGCWVGTYLAVCLHSGPSGVLKSSESCINSTGQLASSFSSSCFSISLTLSAAEEMLGVKILLPVGWQMTEFRLEGCPSVPWLLLPTSTCGTRASILLVGQSSIAPALDRLSLGKWLWLSVGPLSPPW